MFPSYEINPVPYDCTTGRPSEYPVQHFDSLYKAHEEELILNNSRIRLIMGHYDYGARVYNSRDIIILRNPIERAWSEWRHHFQNINSKSAWGKATEGITNIKDFLDTPEGFSRLSNQQTRILCGERWSGSPYSLNVARYNLNQSIVGVTSKLNLFVQKISEKFLLPYISLPVTNSVRNFEIPKDIYSLLRQLNQDDLELYHIALSI